MKAEKVTPNFTDDRGVIADILYNEPVDHITVITSKKGVTRGNHYHKKTVQWVYLQTGRMEVICQREGEPPLVQIMEPGELVRTDPLEQHTMHALEDSVFFVFTRGPRGGKDYESDTFRLETPLTASTGGQD